MTYGYVRVSTADQKDSGAGLSAQRSTILAAYPQAEIHEEVQSGRSLEARPVLQQILESLRLGDVLVAAKLDRISRSVKDFAGILESSKRGGWRLVVLDIQVDTGTPVGVLVVNILAAVAQFERELIGTRTREALAAKKAAGTQLGRRSSLEPSTVTLIQQLRAEGLSFARIAHELTERGIPTPSGGDAWRASTIAYHFPRRNGK